MQDFNINWDDDSDRNDEYEFGNSDKILYNNRIDNNSVNGVEYYPYDHYDDVLESKIKTHEKNINNPHDVTCNQIGAVSFQIDQTLSGDIERTDQEIAKKNIGLGNVMDTGDSDKPVENGDKKFTTGGAYKLQQEDIRLDKKIDKANENIDELTPKVNLNDWSDKIDLVLENNGEVVYKKKINSVTLTINANIEHGFCSYVSFVCGTDSMPFDIINNSETTYPLRIIKNNQMMGIHEFSQTLLRGNQYNLMFICNGINLELYVQSIQVVD